MRAWAKDMTVELTTENELPVLELGAAPDKKIRGPHEIRRAATYKKVISAGISILYINGYQATTTTSVAEKAGISRGALLHQFPTKNDLIVGIAEYLVKQYNDEKDSIFKEISSPLEQFKRLTDVLWERSRQESTIALIEVCLASRSDSTLALNLKPHVNETVRSQLDDACRLAKRAGIENEDAIKALTILTTAAVWGLGIFRLEASYEDEIERAFSLLKKRRDELIENLLK